MSFRLALFLAFLLPTAPRADDKPIDPKSLAALNEFLTAIGQKQMGPASTLYPRVLAVELAGDRNPTATQKKLAQALMDQPDARVRELGGQYCAQVSDGEAFNQMARLAAEDPHLPNREAFVWILPQGFGEKATPVLRNILLDAKQPKGVRRKAIEQLTHSGLKDGFELVQTLLEEPEGPESMHHDALYFLGELHLPEGVLLLESIARRPKPNTLAERAFDVLLANAGSRDSDPEKEKARETVQRAFIRLASELGETVPRLADVRATLNAIEKVVTEDRPPLLKMLKGANPEIRAAGARLLARGKLKDDVPAIWSAFRVSPPADLKMRSESAPAYGTLAAALVELGEPVSSVIPALVDKAEELVRGLQRDRLPDMKAFEQLRERLPEPLQAAFDAERLKRHRTAAAEKAKAIPACDALCGLVKQAALWDQEKFFLEPEGPDGQKRGWELATRALKALFLIRAAPYCKEAKELYSKLREHWLKPQPKAEKVSEAPAPRRVGEQGGSGSSEDKIDLKAVLDELKVGLNPEAIDALDRLARASADATRADPPQDAPTVYGKQFYGLFLRQMMQDPVVRPEDQLKIGLAIRANERSLIEDVRRFGPAVKGIHGSLFNTFAFTTSILALPEPPDNALTALDAMLGAARTPASVPYNPNRWSESPRAAAARAVPAQLAALLRPKPGADKDKLLDNLDFAVDNFLSHMPSLIAHVPRNDVHVEKDALAPYYFYPSVPYVAAALRALEARAQDPKKKEKYRQWRTELTGGLLTLLQSDGLFTPQGQVVPGAPPKKPDFKFITKEEAEAEERKPKPSDYKSSPGYVNPLSGLALVALVDQCEGKAVPASLGILDLSLEQTLDRPAPARDH